MSSLMKSASALKVQPLRWLSMNAVFANFSNGLMYISMTWILLSNQNSIRSLAILMICFWGPTVILGPLCGLIADRYRRKPLMILSNFTRGIVLLFLAIVLTRNLAAWEVYSLAIMLSICGNLYGPAAFAYITEVAPKAELLHANTIMAMAYEIGNIVGMGSAGLLIALHSARIPMSLSGALFMVSTLCLLAIRENTPKAAPKKIHHGVWQELTSGLRYLANNETLRVLYATQLFLMINFFTAPILLAPFAKNLLHATPGEFGLIQAFLSVGVMLGGIMAPFLVEIGSLKKVVLTEVMLIAVLFLLFSTTMNVYFACIIYFLLGITLSAWTLIITKAQLNTDPNFLARSQAAFNSLAALVILGLYLLLNLGGDFIPIRILYVVEALFTVSAVYLLWRNQQVLV